MDLTSEYWRERADRVRRTADVVDEEARTTLLRIAGNYESLARQAQREKSTKGANQVGRLPLAGR